MTGMDYRLPTTVIPSRYDLRLEPDLEAATFTGEESISVTVNEPVTEVVLNAAELAIQSVAAERGDGVVVQGSAALDSEAERARLLFPTPLEPGNWQLRLGFTGVLNDRLHGFYRSTYKDEAGVSHTIAATQFESTDARRGFPCWDEPAFKAVFGVSLIVPEGLAAVSNAAVVGESPAGVGKKVVTFADTIRMSTYLVAFVVGELEATDPVMVGKTPLRVWCVPAKKRLARYAAAIGAFSVEFFERYYGMPYPGDKLDLLAIPDFAAGAMENLGAVTFRETALLVDETAASHAELERVADVVAHEIAHMWFGDLVTMVWWNGIWLNEAFATFMELLAVDAWKPEWKRWVTFGTSRGAAMGVDGLHNTRPIEFEVRAPRDCEAMFDLLTYEKGASVLRMLEQHLGPEVFREGVRQYLGRHRFANAETTDLWKALGDAARQPIPEVMDGWIFRPGYPLVTVEPDGQGLRLSQRRFTYLEGADDEPWRIPVLLRAWVKRGIVEKHVLLDGREVVVSLPAAADWVVVNAGGHGFYRVRYAAPLLKKLLGALARVEPIDRFNLVGDCFALTQAGAMSASEYLDLTARFTAETDRNVWTVLAGSFAYLARVVARGVRPGLAALIRHRVTPAAERLGWDPESEESELERQLRGELLRLLGTLGDDPTTQERARELYARHRADEAAVDPNVLPALIAIVAWTGGEEQYASFLDRFKNARTPQEEQRYLYALAGFRQPELLSRTLDLSLSGEVRSQDAPFLLRSLLGSVYGRELAWAFVKEHWEMMARQYPGSAYRRMWEGVTGLISADWERDVRDFFSSRGIVLGGKTLEQYLEQLHVAVSFQEREREALVAYLGRQRR
ncbi:MAG TPA: M1 family metallopeptidase [Candidatus Methylomirabilis sp.]|nr:M1 family metallopeptidase [Candidatus Methylomirabilis sp.]